MAINLAERLLIQPQTRVLLQNAPIGYAKKLQPLPEGVTITDRRGQESCAVAIVFIRDTMELKRLRSGFPALEEDAALWLCYPTRGTDVTGDVLNASLASAELAGDPPFAFDDTWSCMRFRTPEDTEG